MEELSSKKRAELRSMATNLEPVVLIGKSCLSDEIIDSIAEAFNTRELLKIAVLNNADVNLKDTAVEIADKVKCQVVAITGHKIVFFKMNPKLRQEAAEKAKRAKIRQQKEKEKSKRISKEANNKTGKSYRKKPTNKNYK